MLKYGFEPLAKIEHIDHNLAIRLYWESILVTFWLFQLLFLWNKPFPFTKEVIFSLATLTLCALRNVDLVSLEKHSTLLFNSLWWLVYLLCYILYVLMYEIFLKQELVLMIFRVKDCTFHALYCWGIYCLLLPLKNIGAEICADTTYSEGQVCGA